MPKHYKSSEDVKEPETLNRDMWAILCAKAIGEAEEKMDGCNQDEGLWAYL